MGSDDLTNAANEVPVRCKFTPWKKHFKFSDQSVQTLN